MLEIEELTSYQSKPLKDDGLSTSEIHNLINGLILSSENEDFNPRDIEKQLKLVIAGHRPG